MIEFLNIFAPILSAEQFSGLLGFFIGLSTGFSLVKLFTPKPNKQMQVLARECVTDKNKLIPVENWLLDGKIKAVECPFANSGGCNLNGQKCIFFKYLF